MKGPLPPELLHELRSSSPELIPVLVSFLVKGHIGVDSRLPTRELKWLLAYFPDIVIHQSPEVSVPRDPRSTFVCGPDLSAEDIQRLSDQISPAHLVVLPVREDRIREQVDSVLKNALVHSPSVVDSEYLNPRLKVRPASQSVPALFLDRDGTMIELVPYITDPRLVVLKPGIVALIQWARNQGLMVVCVTNQSGVGRALYDWNQFDAIQSRMDELLSREGVSIDASFAAGYHSGSEFIEGHLAPGLRKPAPGMLTWAAHCLNLDLTRSIMIGDSEVDIEAGQRAGCPFVFRITESRDLLQILEDLKRVYKFHSAVN